MPHLLLAGIYLNILYEIGQTEAVEIRRTDCTCNAAFQYGYTLHIADVSTGCKLRD